MKKISELEIGSKVKFGRYAVDIERQMSDREIVWIVVAKDHKYADGEKELGFVDYPENTVTLLSEKIIDLRPLDAKEKTGSGVTYVADSGNATYSISNLDRWLQGTGTNWYGEGAHAYDNPPTSDKVLYGTAYADHPGFLTLFEDAEREAIVTTRLYDSDLETTYDRKVFIPSFAELNFSVGKGWKYFEGKTAMSRVCGLTKAAYDFSKSTIKPESIESNWGYWTRGRRGITTAHRGNAVSATDGYNEDQSLTVPLNGQYGVRPAMNVTADVYVTDVVDDSGCYNTVWYRPPSPAPNIDLEGDVGYRGDTLVVHAGIPYDQEPSEIIFEKSVNDAPFYEVARGASRVYEDVIDEDALKIAYRVYYRDQNLAPSEAVEVSLDVVYVGIPDLVIDGVDAGTGYIDITSGYEPPSVENDLSLYVSVLQEVGDTADEVNVDVSINGKVVYTEAVNGYGPFVIALPRDAVVQIKKGVTNKILARAYHPGHHGSVGDACSVVRNVTSCSVVTDPMKSVKCPVRALVSVSMTKPQGAIFSAKICNNAYDPNPYWEDMTQEVLSGDNHVFTNTEKTADYWGVAVKVELDRNGTEGECYINSIGGFFD